MKKVFLSYRRDDSEDVIGRIYDSLVDEFGSDQVFKDVDSIPGGADFRRVIHEKLSESDVVVVTIGPDWFQTRTDGSRRIDDENDFVRLEVESALSKGKLVIPVLLGATPMPTEDTLPNEIKKLAYLNARRVRPDPDFKNDLDRLVRAIEQNTEEIRRQNNRKSSGIIIVVAVLFVAFGGWLIHLGDDVRQLWVSNPSASFVAPEPGIEIPYKIVLRGTVSRAHPQKASYWLVARDSDGHYYPQKRLVIEVNGTWSYQLILGKAWAGRNMTLAIVLVPHGQVEDIFNSSIGSSTMTVLPSNAKILRTHNVVVRGVSSKIPLEKVTDSEWSKYTDQYGDSLESIGYWRATDSSQYPNHKVIAPISGDARHGYVLDSSGEVFARIKLNKK